MSCYNIGSCWIDLFLIENQRFFIPQWSKLLFTSLLTRNLWWRMGAPSIFTCWIRIELSVVLFMPLLIHGSFFLKEVVVLKYFIIQSVRGLLILSLLFTGFSQDLTAITRFRIMLIFILKTGTFPFFQWVVSLGERISWYPLFILLSVQKIIPLIFISHFCSREIELVALIGWAVLPLLVMSTKKIKSLVTVSSIFMFLAILCSLCRSVFKWKNLIILYLLALCPVRVLGDSPLRLKVFTLGSGASSYLAGWRVVLLSFMGVPPLPGFLVKAELFRILLERRVTMSMVFLSGRMLIVWVYLNLWFLIITPVHMVWTESLISELTIPLTSLICIRLLLLI